MVDTDEFWNSGLPFISDAEGRRIDWTDAGLTALATVATSYVSSVADLIGVLWQVFVITPANTLAGYYSDLVATVTTGVAGLFQFGPAIALADQLGFIGAVALLAVGGYIMAVVAEEVTDG